MFLPARGEAGEVSVEERSDEHPIILEQEGRVKSPTQGYVPVLIRIGFYLQIRSCAIFHLSTLDLGPVEKILLTRAHNVGKWFHEGTTIIMTTASSVPLQEPLPLGVETVCRLL